MSALNLISISKLDTSSIAANSQTSALDQLAKARSATANNWAKQTEDNAQKAKAPNDINAHIDANRRRTHGSQDLIDIRNINSEAIADSYENQGLSQAAEVGKPKAYGITLGIAKNGGWQTQKSSQDVDSYNKINARIDQPGMRRVHNPTANIFVDKVDSNAYGNNVQLQDLTQDAKVGKNTLTYYCPPVTPGGHATNVADQYQKGGQDVDSQNRIDIRENIGGGMRNPDPAATRLTSTATGDNVQAQSALQDALTKAQSRSGADASGYLTQNQINGQDVNSANVVNMRVNDRLSASQAGIAEKLTSTSLATNLQDQVGSQSSITEYKGAATNSGTQGQWSDQDVGSGNWVNVRL